MTTHAKLMNVFTAPEDITPALENGAINIFLIGSIEMGKAIDWQPLVIGALSFLRCNLLNPRRADWDPSWEQSSKNANFAQQVMWEQQGIECAEHVFIYIDPDTLSPITLLEFGQIYEMGTSFTLVCPKGFWRRGNLEVMCEAIGKPIFETLEEGLIDVQRIIGDYNKVYNS